MTNYLKELVSFRQWYMMDQTSVMERAKEEGCYVTLDWERDWLRASFVPILPSLPSLLPFPFALVLGVGGWWEKGGEN